MTKHSQSYGPAANDPFVALNNSLNHVLRLLPDSLHESHHDEALATIAMSDAEFVDPLSKSEVLVLACALINSKRDMALGYDDVVKLTARHGPKPMNVATIYKTIERLEKRGMLDEHNHLIQNRQRRYSITECGKVAFRLAIMNSAINKEALDRKKAA